MIKAKILLGFIILWWGIEIFYTAFMLGGLRFWTKIREEDKFSYHLYLIELFLNIKLIMLWYCTWVYNIQLKINKYYWNICVALFIIHSYFGIMVFRILPYDNYPYNIIYRRFNAYEYWILWFIMCVYLQVGYINQKLANTKEKEYKIKIN